MECNARVIVGLEVQHEDFWTEKVHKDDFISCPNGHEGQTGKFCSECGAALGYQEHTKLVANPNFAALVGDSDPKGRAGEAWNPERDFCSEDRANPNAFGIPELQLLCVDGELGVDDAPKFSPSASSSTMSEASGRATAPRSRSGSRSRRWNTTSGCAATSAPNSASTGNRSSTCTRAAAETSPPL